MSILYNKRTLTILLFLLLITISVYVYSAYYSPLVVEIESTEQKLKAEEKLIEALEVRVNDVPSETRVVTSNLQQRLPVKPMTDKLLLDFEKVELLSNSLITSISFIDGEEGEGETAQNQGAETDENENLLEEGWAPPLADEQIRESDMSTETLPAGIRKISAQLTVESPSYAEMEKFLSELENQIRIIEIEQLTFEGPEELTKLRGEEERLTYNVNVTAYYMPELLDLMQDTPKVDTPEPAEKKEPFAKID